MVCLLESVPLILVPSTSTSLSSVTTASRTKQRRLKSPRKARSLKMELPIRNPMPRRRRRRRQVVTSPLATRKRRPRPAIRRKATRLLLAIRNPLRARKSLKMPRRTVIRRKPSLIPSQRRLSSRRMASSLRLIPRRPTSRPPCPATPTCKWSTMLSTRSRSLTLL